MTRRVLPSAFLLPLGSLLLWTCLVAVPTTLNYINIQQGAHGANVVRLHSGVLTAVVPRPRFFAWSLQIATGRDFPVIEAINLPAVTVDALASHLAHTWPSSWAPRDVFVHSWRAATFPIYALPFWWFVGIGLDDLLQRRTLRWFPRLLGMLLWAFTLFLLIGFAFAMTAAERGSLTYPLWGFALWSALLAVFPVGWSTLLRRRRANHSSQS